MPCMPVLRQTSSEARRDSPLNRDADAPTPVLPLSVVSVPTIQRWLPVVGNIAYLGLASGFMMTDMLALRCLLVFGYLSLTCFHIFQLRPLRIPLVGSFFFVLVNAYFGIAIYLDRQASLSDEERDIFESHFSEHMLDYEFQKIIRAAEVVTVSSQTRLVNLGDVHTKMFYVLDGEARLTFADLTYVAADQADFIASGSFISTPIASRSHIDGLPGCRYICWDLETLKLLVQKHPQARRGLEVKIGRKVARKLRETNKRLSRTEHQLLIMRMCFGTKKNTIQEALQDVFHKYDTDRDGFLHFKDFQSMMNNFVDTPVNTMQTRDLFDTICKDNSAHISVHEFLQWATL